MGQVGRQLISPSHSHRVAAFLTAASVCDSIKLMQYRLRTLLILMAIGPPAIALLFWHWSVVLPHWTLVIVLVALWLDYRRRQYET